MGVLVTVCVVVLDTQRVPHQDFEGTTDGFVKLVHANRVGELVNSPRMPQSFI